MRKRVLSVILSVALLFTSVNMDALANGIQHMQDGMEDTTNFIVSEEQVIEDETSKEEQSSQVQDTTEVNRSEVEVPSTVQEESSEASSEESTGGGVN